MIPVVSPEGYAAARQRAALVDRADRARVVVSGSDRASFLQGLLTNDVVALQAGQGCYTAYLTAQGRMIADMYVYELGDVMLLTLLREVKDSVLTKLDQVIFSEDVRLGDVSDTFAQAAIVGPRAAAIVADVLGVQPATIDALPPNGNARLVWSDRPVIVTRADDLGEPGFDLFIERSHDDSLRGRLLAAGAIAIDAPTADAIRLEAGVPLFRRDMDEETIPLEAGIESRAISFTKGCYVGQEVVIRVLHRGHGRVVRKLVGLRLKGDRPPAPGSPIRVAEREIGHVTSSAISPALQQPIALGYVHRDFVEPGTAVAVDGAAARVAALPFVSDRSAASPPLKP